MVSKNRGVDFGSIRFEKNAWKQVCRSLIWPGQQTLIGLTPSSDYTPVDAFIMHASCYRLLCHFAKSNVLPMQLYRLCQAIQPDQARQFLSDMEIAPNTCPDPFTPLRPQKSIPSSRETCLFLQANLNNDSSIPLFKLPSEVLLLVLGYLSPSDLVRFFRTSKQALSYANVFCCSHPLHFFRCDAHTGKDSDDKRPLMIAFSIWPRYHELDLRWQIVIKIAELARLLPLLDVKASAARDLDHEGPSLIGFQYGLSEEFMDIPVTVKRLIGYAILLNDVYYVCGVGFIACGSESFIGSKTGSLRIIDICHYPTDEIWLAEDALGVRSLKYGNSPWLFGDPEYLGCWEGISLRHGPRRLRISRDALKFRHLSWLHQSDLFFEETLLVRNEHPSRSSQNVLERELYVQQNPTWESELVNKFGKVPTEAMWFSKDLKIIKIYAEGRLGGITGISMCTGSDDHSVGLCKGRFSFLELRTPHEIVTEIDVWKCEISPLALTFRTNHNRQLSTEPCQHGIEVSFSIKTLRAPPNYHIRGLLLRFENSILACIGLILGQV
ncbi:uncharacterized protein BO87DRAFT_381261 [Aspergillus neoniger CBS 115656]|uniref:F-box domain-containing protein n=1 Tax=Aspergillus neoniger (strain CBS 115656) TaxID=1448310 RepID=A0A318YJP5_ASPNB|nr:hypothetical protein BO87DRAFT_381261 [Aspergillus neoniger CBS 115656]PYH28518.1 hypothetical protein BO87DRAFT_381261 [Aspergillus neoniger CBS 115656]